MRNALIAANWKANGDKALVEQMNGLLEQVSTLKQEVVVCAPFVYMYRLATQANSALGAQDISLHDGGAFTGEVTGNMLQEFGCQYVIVGHSERREYHNETNDVVAAKFKQAQACGLTPILCIGESLEVREAGEVEEFLKVQLDAVIDAAGIEALNKAVVAYEPIWAIGTGVTATPEQAQQTHKFIRDYLSDKDAGVANKVQILYGGSVNDANAETLFAEADIDGALVGGASLKTEAFRQIIESVKE